MLKSYHKKVDQVGVDLIFPEAYESYYQEAKNDYLHKLYADGIDKLNRDEFGAAQKVFDQILDVDPDFKDAADKYKIAVYEPVYRSANSYFENESFRVYALRHKRTNFNVMGHGRAISKSG